MAEYIKFCVQIDDVKCLTTDDKPPLKLLRFRK